MPDADAATRPPVPPPRRGDGHLWRVGVCILRLPWELLCFARHLFGILVWLRYPRYARAAAILPCRHGDGVAAGDKWTHQCVYGTRYRNRWLFRLLCHRSGVMYSPAGATICICAKDGAFRPPLTAFLIIAVAFAFAVVAGVFVLLRVASLYTGGLMPLPDNVIAKADRAAGTAPAATVADAAEPVEAPIAAMPAVPAPAAPKAVATEPDTDGPAEVAAFLARARAYLAEGTPAAARIEFKNAVALDPDNAALQMELGECAWKCNRLPEAWQCFLRAADLDPQNAAAEQQLTRLATARGDLAAAVEHATRLCALQPQDPEAQTLRAKALLALGKTDLARDAVVAALKLAPDQGEMLAVLAELELQAQDVAGAEQHFRRALELQPDLAAAQVGLARTLLARRQAAPAVEFLESALRKQPDRAALIEALCEAHLAAGHVDAAAGLCARSLARNPTAQTDETWLVRSVIRVAECHIANGTADAALEVYRDALAKRPAFVELRRRRADLLVQTGAADEAYKVVRQLQQNDSDSVGTNLLLAEIFARKGLPAAADEYCAKAEAAGRQDARLPRIRKIRARAALEADDFDLARRELEQFLNAVPADLEGRVWLASCYRQLGRPDEAATCLRTAAEKNPSSALPLILLGQACLLRNDAAGATEYYRQALGRTPENLLALNNLAELLSAQPQGGDEAKTLATKAYELYPQSAEAVDTLGWVLFRQGDLKRAVSLLRDAVKLRANHPTLRYHLAEALHAAGQPAEAAEQVRRALAFPHRFPESQAAETLLRKLQSAGPVLGPVVPRPAAP